MGNYVGVRECRVAYEDDDEGEGLAYIIVNPDSDLPLCGHSWDSCVPGQPGGNLSPRGPIIEIDDAKLPEQRKLNIELQQGHLYIESPETASQLRYCESRLERHLDAINRSESIKRKLNTSIHNNWHATRRSKAWDIAQQTPRTPPSDPVDSDEEREMSGMYPGIVEATGIIHRGDLIPMNLSQMNQWHKGQRRDPDSRLRLHPYPGEEQIRGEERF